MRWKAYRSRIDRKCLVFIDDDFLVTTNMAPRRVARGATKPPWRTTCAKYCRSFRYCSDVSRLSYRFSKRNSVSVRCCLQAAPPKGQVLDIALLVKKGNWSFGTASRSTHRNNSHGRAFRTLSLKASLVPTADTGSQLERRVILGGTTARLARMLPASLPSRSMEVSMPEQKLCRIPRQARSAAPHKE
jgi:hypothetical protein